MGTMIRQICIAAVSAIAVTGAAIGTSAPANAQHHWHGGGGFGPGFVGGFALGAATAPYYYGGPYAYDYGPGCYIRREVFINRWGHRVIRHVRVCD